jgi:flagellar basal-body rod modification protein FlgD
MSSVTPTTSPVGTAPTTSASNPAAILGQDGFLQLLVAEMQNQDPLSQSQQDPTQSVTQMAQFSSVEQLTNLVQSNQQAQSIGLIGHTVAYTDAAGNPGSGVVDAVTFNQGQPVIDIAGTGISLSQIVGVS